MSRCCRSQLEQSHCEPRSGVAIQNTKSSFRISYKLIRHSEPLSTTPRTKRVHSNSNRKNTFSDYEFSIFTLSWISSMLTEFRQRNSVPKASICSLSGMNAVQKFALLGLPKNLMQTRIVIQRTKSEESQIKQTSNLVRDLSLCSRLRNSTSFRAFRRRISYKTQSKPCQRYFATAQDDGFNVAFKPNRTCNVTCLCA